MIVNKPDRESRTNAAPKKTKGPAEGIGLSLRRLLRRREREDEREGGRRRKSGGVGEGKWGKGEGEEGWWRRGLRGGRVVGREKEEAWKRTQRVRGRVGGGKGEGGWRGRRVEMREREGEKEDGRE